MGLFPAINDARVEAHALYVGGAEGVGGEGEHAQEGVVADDLGEVGEGPTSAAKAMSASFA
jgi:hypothetical protein